MSEVTSNRFIATAVHALRLHRLCGDQYIPDGWPEVNEALAEYAKHKRMWKRFKRARRRRAQPRLESCEWTAEEIEAARAAADRLALLFDHD